MTKDSIICRKATSDELLKLWDYEDIDSASPTARFFCQNISSGNAVFWTLDDNGKLIGELYTFYDLDDRDFADGKSTAYLCAFRVRKDHRGSHLGTLLMNTALNDLKNHGFIKATIGVSSDEPHNIEMYRHYGFTEKIRDCNYDPCAMDENMMPEYDEQGWWLLARDL